MPRLEPRPATSNALSWSSAQRTASSTSLASRGLRVSVIRFPRLFAGTVYNAKQNHLVSKHLIKDEIGIADQRHPANARAFSHLLKTIWKPADPLPDLIDPVGKAPRTVGFIPVSSDRMASNSFNAKLE